MKPRILLKPGDEQNHLTILSFDHSDDRGRRFFLCRCKCGVEKVLQASLITSGNTKSCGCWGKIERRTRNLLPENGGVINHIILQYKRHARDRGIPFLLSREEVDRIVRLPCVYCGTVAGNLKRTKNCREGFPHNGIDRVDPSLPYVSTNVVAACGFCNKAKQSKTGTEFLAWVNRVVEFQRAMAEQWGNFK